MTRDEKIQRIIERAIQSAFIDFPDAGKRDDVAAKLQRTERVQDCGNRHPLGSQKCRLQNYVGFKLRHYLAPLYQRRDDCLVRSRPGGGLL